MFASHVKAIYGLLSLTLYLPVLVSAQQYVGAPIANQSGALPPVGGSSITYFNILDPNKKNATLTNYVSFNSSGAYMPPAKMQRLVIVIHGLDRDPSTYMSNLLVAIPTTPGGPTVDNTQLIAPYFPNVSRLPEP